MPLYPFFKFCILVWMFAPSMLGAKFVYLNLICPFCKIHALSKRGIVTGIERG